MGESTKISWADHTFSPWIGCSRVHAGCTYCYAEAMAARFAWPLWGPEGARRRTSYAYWQQPAKWNEQAAREGVQRYVFPSLCDPFEEFNGKVIDCRGHQLYHSDDGTYCGGDAAKRWGMTESMHASTLDDMRADFFQVIDDTPDLTWILLTKRPENVVRMCSGMDGATPISRRNVWLLYSASDQLSYDAGIAQLVSCAQLFPVIGVSLEPLIGPVDLKLDKPAQGDDRSLVDRLGWVIVGGESGPHARPCAAGWLRSVIHQCQRPNTQVACFVKQLGSAYSVHVPDNPVRLVREELQHPKGGDPAEWPTSFRVQEYPDI